MLSSKRVIIDGSMARNEGSVSYLINIVPSLSHVAPLAQFKVLISSEKLADALQPHGNIDIAFLGCFDLKRRLRFNYLQAGTLAAKWGADLYFSTGETLPLNLPCPTIASFRNPNVFAFGDGQGVSLKQRVRFRLLNQLARLSARASDRVMFENECSADSLGDAINLPQYKRAVLHHDVNPELLDWNQNAKRLVTIFDSVLAEREVLKDSRIFARSAAQRQRVTTAAITGLLSGR